MLPPHWMSGDGPEPLAHDAPVLVIEADSSARLRHEIALRAAGYQVRAFHRCPGATDLHGAAAVLADLPSFQWLGTLTTRRLPPIVVVADDTRAGVAACLQGAAAWAPTDGQIDYLVDTVEGILHPRHATRGVRVPSDRSRTD